MSDEPYLPTCSNACVTCPPPVHTCDSSFLPTFIRTQPVSFLIFAILVGTVYANIVMPLLCRLWLIVSWGSQFAKILLAWTVYALVLACLLVGLMGTKEVMNWTNDLISHWNRFSLWLLTTVFFK